ncbi:Metallo-dependent phosphatase [Panus rudis PR-1116 ss-1]|nr:Metallo-dependent phosphatase [Panus rudis PR-1116 ss-1]
MPIPTVPRLARFIRSIFVPATAIFCFSCLLTFIFILYQPTPGPGSIQRLGWQSWDIVIDTPGSDHVDVEEKPAGQDTSGAISSPEQPVGSQDPSHEVDWWNVSETTAPQFDPVSLPLDVWDPLMPHDTGLSEIAVTQCWVSPGSLPWVPLDVCAPWSTKELDTTRGKWVLVNQNLKRQGYGALNIYYRRTRRLDIPLISDIRILSDGQTPYGPGESSDVWHLVSRSISPHGEKKYIWYKAEKMLRQMSDADKQNMITEIDVMFGDDKPWYGFEKVEPPAAPQQNFAAGVWVTIRRGVKPPPRAPPLHFSRDGKFKVLQVADLHFSVTAGVCRDTLLSPCEGSDNITNSLISHVLDVENPDMVVFTGDQLNGQGTSWDAKSVLAKFAQTVTDRGIPWAAVFGNHDDEDGESREAQIKWMQGLPYSLVESGPKDIHGVGNYLLKVYSADPSKTQLLTLYFLDSGSYSRGWYDPFGLVHGTEYDWIHQDQIDWFLEESSRISSIERPFTPDGAKDMGGLWSRQSSDQYLPSTRRLAKPNALMFFHIPLEEAYSKADTDPSTGKPLDVGQSGVEPHGNAKKQDGFFHKGILQALETDHRAGGNTKEVKVIANGHCHITENCRRIKGVWMCFGGGGSYSGYGKIGFDRRFRLYDISDYGETIRTYKRTEHDEIVDDMILVGNGAPQPYQG